MEFLESRVIMQTYDIIGDIHGYASQLEQLLTALGYREKGGVYQHSDKRKVIFLGDYIDRGPAIRRTLEIVRGMTDANHALAILGNHEVNALRFHAHDAQGNFLRPHTDKNVKQHKETLLQLCDGREMTEWLDWFATLPLFLELPGLRAVHACWDRDSIQKMTACGPLRGKILERFSRIGTADYETISRLLNGPEANLPEGFQHQTADGRVRNDFRVKWWVPLAGLTCREAIFPETEEVPESAPIGLPDIQPYDSACPTFFGHYALKKELAPKLITPRLACLDFGIGKGGFLCAYRWDGEQELEPEKFVYAK